MKTFKPLIALLCLGLILAGCGDTATQCLTPVINSGNNLPTLSTAEAIQLSKPAAAKLQSPPRTHDTCYSNKDNTCPETFQDWPDTPGTNVYSCTLGNDVQNSPCYPKVETYTTSISPDSPNAGQYITFSSEWTRTTTPNGHHSWQSYVGNDRQVQFLCEQGDPLPKRPE